MVRPIVKEVYCRAGALARAGRVCNLFLCNLCTLWLLGVYEDGLNAHGAEGHYGCVAAPVRFSGALQVFCFFQPQSGLSSVVLLDGVLSQVGGDLTAQRFAVAVFFVERQRVEETVAVRRDFHHFHDDFLQWFSRVRGRKELSALHRYV